MKYCPNCHLTYEDNANVCGRCGGQLSYYPNQPQYQQAQPAFDPTDHTAEFDAQDISSNKVLAMIPYLMGWIGIIVTLIASASSPYAFFHVKQALKIEVCSTLLALIVAVLCWTIIVPVAGAVCFVILWVVKIICFFQVCKGQAKEPAIVKNFAFLK